MRFYILNLRSTSLFSSHMRSSSAIASARHPLPPTMSDAKKRPSSALSNSSSVEERPHQKPKCVLSGPTSLCSPFTPCAGPAREMVLKTKSEFCNALVRPTPLIASDQCMSMCKPSAGAQVSCTPLKQGRADQDAVDDALKDPVQDPVKDAIVVSLCQLSNNPHCITVFCVAMPSDAEDRCEGRPR